MVLAWSLNRFILYWITEIKTTTVTSSRNLCVLSNWGGNFVFLPLPSSINLINLNFEREVDPRKRCETWRVPFIDANQLAAEGFYFTNLSDISWCVFCGLEICYWAEGDVGLKENQRSGHLACSLSG